MKIAFDEHIAPPVVVVFKALAEQGFLRGYGFVSARDYHASIDPKNDDRPWLQRFKEDGGHVVITGDRKMRGRPHERRALKDAGFTVMFLGRPWDEMERYGRAAILVRWWPVIEKHLPVAPPATFWEIPCTWTLQEVLDVTGPNS